jgi:hypothetical protein
MIRVDQMISDAVEGTVNPALTILFGNPPHIHAQGHCKKLEGEPV